MGAYNVLKVRSQCEKCKNETEIKVQFKYGDVWQYEYQLGDVLKWGGNDIGTRGAKKIVLDGISENCEFCGVQLDYVIHLEFDKIMSVELNIGQYKFSSNKECYLVLER